jgi:hypothetical protein
MSYVEVDGIMVLTHDCDLLRYPSQAHGAAVESCFEDKDGKLWVDNVEYATQVNFCPACGYKARVPV